MSNLCYNCGDCHFPQPCPAALKLCDICSNTGHAFNFCPLSVRRKDPTYQFWALCHNCDKWHLPDPCQYQLHKCNQCSSYGHKEYFCAVMPLTREATRDLYASAHEAKTGEKRQRWDEDEKSDAQMEGLQVSKPSFEMIRSIKDKAANDTLMLLDRGVPREFIAHYVRGDFLGDTSNVDILNIFPTPGAPTIGPPQHTPQTPASLRNQVYALQHDRFNDGQLAHSTANVDVTPTPPSQDWMLQNPVPATTVGNSAKASEGQLQKSAEVSVPPGQQVDRGSLAQVLNPADSNPTPRPVHSPIVSQDSSAPLGSGSQGVGNQGNTPYGTIYDNKEFWPASDIEAQHIRAITDAVQSEGTVPVDSVVQTPIAEPPQAQPKAKKPRGPRKRKQ